MVFLFLEQKLKKEKKRRGGESFSHSLFSLLISVGDQKIKLIGIGILIRVGLIVRWFGLVFFDRSTVVCYLLCTFGLYEIN